MRTFLDVFPHTTLWLDGNLMVGSVAPLHLDPATLEAKRANPRTAAALDDIGLTSYEVLKPGHRQAGRGGGDLWEQDRYGRMSDRCSRIITLPDDNRPRYQRAHSNLARSFMKPVTLPTDFFLDFLGGWVLLSRLGEPSAVRWREKGQRSRRRAWQKPNPSRSETR